MNDQKERQKLDDVLDALVASGTEPNSPSFVDWIRRYPQYEQELIEFAASWSLMTWLPLSPDGKEVDEETLVLRGMSIVQNILHRQEQEATGASIQATPIASLIKQGRECGLSPHQLAQAAGLGDSLLRKLDRRLVRFTSIPHQAIEALAAVLQRDTNSITSYLQQNPTFAPSTLYRAERIPELTKPEDFFDAVRADPTIPSEQRTRLLSMALPDDAR